MNLGTPGETTVVLTPAPGFAQVEEMIPGERSQNWMSGLSLLLSVLGLVLGVAMAAWHGLDRQLVVMTSRSVLAALVGCLAVTVLTLAAHEVVHGIAMMLCGARPRFGAGVQHTGLPYLYTTAEGHLFTRTQFTAIALAPNVLVNLALVGLLLVGPHPAWWVVPLALHLSGGVGDAWLVWAAIHERNTTLIEDQKAGMRVHRRSLRPGRPKAHPAT